MYHRNNISGRDFAVRANHEGFKVPLESVYVSPLACTDWCIKTSAHFCKGAGHERGGVS